MMKKTLDLNKTVYELAHEHAEFVNIMAEVGFKDITKPLALNTMGRIMTVPKGCAIKGISLEKVVEAFRAKGFEVVGYDEMAETCQPEACGSCDHHDHVQQEHNEPAEEGLSPDRQKLLKGFIQRLSDGEELESVRKDFLKHFSHVGAEEIAHAEQALIAAGTPVKKVQQLCDVHSALFHQSTRQETAPDADLQKALATTGHPLSVFVGENKEIANRIAALRHELSCSAHSDACGDRIKELLQRVRSLSVHYARKGDLLYPMLSRKYGFSGPSEVMWGVDDEIRDELRTLAAMDAPDLQRLDAVLTRAEEMIYKENNILYPLCAQRFQEDDWMHIYYDMPQYVTDLTPEYPFWPEAEAQRKTLLTPVSDDKESIPLGIGSMTPRQIAAVLNTIPMELTFVDDTDTNRYFNSQPGEKIFKRPATAIDRDVWSCHPPKYQPMVKQIIESFRSGRRDSAEVWLPKHGEQVLVRYMAVRDTDGTYLGTLECVQPMGFAEQHFSGK